MIKKVKFSISRSFKKTKNPMNTFSIECKDSNSDIENKDTFYFIWYGDQVPGKSSLVGMYHRDIK